MTNHGTHGGEKKKDAADPKANRALISGFLEMRAK